MQVLIAAGADVDLQYQRSNGDLWDTALHIAAWHGHLSAGEDMKSACDCKYKIHEFNTQMKPDDIHPIQWFSSRTKHFELFFNKASCVIPEGCNLEPS